MASIPSPERPIEEKNAMSDPEKHGLHEEETVAGLDGTKPASLEGEEVTYTEEEARKVLRKLDFNLLPMIFVLYSLSVLDRSNLGNAKIAGLQDDIDLSGDRYEWLATIFYIAYILFQFSTFGWKVFKPHVWVSFVVFFWGFVATIQSVTTSWGGLMTCRFFLGAAETMFGPGIPLYFSYFYPREKIGSRLGIFLSGSALANAYGSALAFGLSHISSRIHNWQLLFIIEGVPTCLLALVTFFYIPDSPAKARFLNPRERLIAASIAAQQPGDRRPEHKSKISLSQIWDSFKDYKSFILGLIYFGCNVSFASLPLFLPTIISQMGSFSTLQSNGLAAPPYLLCFLGIIGTCWLSDKFKMRGPFLTGAGVIAAVGFIILATTSSTAPRYFGMFLATQIFISVSIILPWVANNTATDTKRATGLWILNAVGQCGPLLGTNVFPSDEAPYYRKGMWICCGFCLLVAVLGATLTSIYIWENKKRDREELGMDSSGVAEGIGEYIETGNALERARGFRYVI